MNIIELMGLSLIVAIASGTSMGLYLAALNRYVPVRSAQKSLINNVVITGSFFIPIALQRVATADPTLPPVAWVSFGLLYLAFSTAADVTNYIWCHRRFK